MELTLKGKKCEVEKILSEDFIHNIVLFSPDNPKIKQGVTYIPANEDCRKSFFNALKWQSCWYSKMNNEESESYLLYNYTVPGCFFLILFKVLKKNFLLLLKKKMKNLFTFFSKLNLNIRRLS